MNIDKYRKGKSKGILGGIKKERRNCPVRTYLTASENAKFEKFITEDLTSSILVRIALRNAGYI